MTPAKNYIYAHSKTEKDEKPIKITNLSGGHLTQRFAFKKPIEFIALCAKSRKDMLSISPAAKPCEMNLKQFRVLAML